jgi:hypothetical protein
MSNLSIPLIGLSYAVLFAVTLNIIRPLSYPRRSQQRYLRRLWPELLPPSVGGNVQPTAVQQS